MAENLRSLHIVLSLRTDGESPEKSKIFQYAISVLKDRKALLEITENLDVRDATQEKLLLLDINRLIEENSENETIKVLAVEDSSMLRVLSGVMSRSGLSIRDVDYVVDTLSFMGFHQDFLVEMKNKSIDQKIRLLDTWCEVNNVKYNKEDILEENKALAALYARTWASRRARLI